ncbi:hypothetical protein PCCS19_39600 [Paenibacillus sp. CCS19]|uniref:hypothetical protein n=1 Tax=Paenibacillus sp. CCS19 TaxID=3158387 RepID=UPI00256603AC|nr:hypothetical protein [Paenibacillus cellulosilyticus]GMK40904.1 hypothetical protein PCCS19_39600 [Paenibacillus cellulosilyticus]
MKLLLDEQGYTQKPQGIEAGKISNRIANCEVDITLDELATEIVKGKSFLPATLKSIDGIKKRRKEHWLSQQVIALDIDDGLSLDEALFNTFIKDNAAFIYTSFSHSPSKHKFRIVFALDKPVTHYEHFERIWSYLFTHLPYADSACRDGVRLFYGGREVHTINMSNRVPVDSVLSKKGFWSDTELISNMSAQNPPSVHTIESPKKQLSVISNHQYANNVDDIRERNIDALRFNLQPLKVDLYNMNEVHDYLKRQDLREFLGINTSSGFCDIFHDELNPSASIFMSSQGSEHYLYKCHSESYPFCGTIIQIVERLLRCSNVEAENFLMSVYNIDLIETELQKHMKRTLDSNKRLLMSLELEQLYPYFFKVIKPYREDLYILFDLVKEYLPSGDDPEIMFYHSLRSIAKQLNISPDSANRRMGLFVLLELFLKYDEDNIPPELMKKFTQWQNQNKYKYRNSVYGVPSYSYDLLSVIDLKCKKYLDNGMTLKSISYEGIYRNFGLEEANRVFPQDANKEINKLNEDVSLQLEKVMLHHIETYGFTTEQLVLEDVKLYFSGQQQYKSSQLKRCLGEIIEKYCLCRKRLDKPLKEKLGFIGNGYPIVMMFQHDLQRLTEHHAISA